jgi:hypothetical protein
MNIKGTGAGAYLAWVRTKNITSGNQWRTQEFFSGWGCYGKKFFQGVSNKFSCGQRTERTGIWGR